MEDLLSALSSLTYTGIIFTMPNCDTDGRVLREMVDNFCLSSPLSRAFTSLGQLRYLSCLQYVDAVVGNSSSGILEAPSFSIGTINIGDRQTGRLAASSVINCSSSKDSIINALDQLYSFDFQRSLSETSSPYQIKNASSTIIRILENFDFSKTSRKSFFDLPLDPTP